MACGKLELSTLKRSRLVALSTLKRSRLHAETVALLYRACIPFSLRTGSRSGTSRGQPCGLPTASAAPTTCPRPFGAPPTGG